MQPELLSCPFCGGKAEFVERYNRYGGLMVFVQCMSCEAQTKVKTFRYNADFEDERTQSKYNFACLELAERWNRRKTGKQFNEPNTAECCAEREQRSLFPADME